MNELKPLPCPFCGGKFVKARHVGGVIGPGRTEVACYTCGALTRGFSPISDVENFANRSVEECESVARSKALAAWNHRTQPNNAPLTLEELRGMDNERVFVLLDDDVCIPALVAYNTEDCNNEDEEDIVYLTNNLGGRSTYWDMLAVGARFYRRKLEGGEPDMRKGKGQLTYCQLKKDHQRVSAALNKALGDLRSMTAAHNKLLKASKPEGGDR